MRRRGDGEVVQLWRERKVGLLRRVPAQEGLAGLADRLGEREHGPVKLGALLALLRRPDPGLDEAGKRREQVAAGRRGGGGDGADRGGRGELRLEPVADDAAVDYPGIFGGGGGAEVLGDGDGALRVDFEEPVEEEEKSVRFFLLLLVGVEVEKKKKSACGFSRASFFSVSFLRRKHISRSQPTDHSGLAAKST